MGTLADYGLPLCSVLLHLKGGEWKGLSPSSVDRLASRHRAWPSGPVLLFSVDAAIAEGCVKAWGRPRFWALAVQDNGRVVTVDLADAVAVLESLAVAPGPQDDGPVERDAAIAAAYPPIPKEWQPMADIATAAFDRAIELIARTAEGWKKVGIRMIPGTGDGLRQDDLICAAH